MEIRNKVNYHLASSPSMNSLSSSVYLVPQALGAQGASKERIFVFQHLHNTGNEPMCQVRLRGLCE